MESHWRTAIQPGKGKGKLDSHRKGGMACASVMYEGLPLGRKKACISFCNRILCNRIPAPGASKQNHCPYN